MPLEADDSNGFGIQNQIYKDRLMKHDKSELRSSNAFAPRHIGPDSAETQDMLKTIGSASLDQLMREAIPERIRLKNPPDIHPAMDEHRYLRVPGADRDSSPKTLVGVGWGHAHIHDDDIRCVRCHFGPPQESFPDGCHRHKIQQT